MKLYRIEPAYAEPKKIFIPVVPQSRLPNEDGHTKRVCVAEDIEGCIIATPFVDSYNPIMWQIFRVYEFEIDINDKNLVLSSELDKYGLVPDALETSECWITKPIEPTNFYYITDVCLCSYGAGARYQSISENELTVPNDKHEIQINLNHYADKFYSQQDIERCIRYIRKNFFEYQDAIYGISVEDSIITIETDLFFYETMFIEELLEELKEL